MYEVRYKCCTVGTVYGPTFCRSRLCGRKSTLSLFPFQLWEILIISYFKCLLHTSVCVGVVCESWKPSLAFSLFSFAMLLVLMLFIFFFECRKDLKLSRVWVRVCVGFWASRVPYLFVNKCVGLPP